MIKIALVGAMGSGKTHISKLFKYPIFNADNEVVNIYKTNLGCFKKLSKEIPNSFNSFPIKKDDLIAAILAKKQNIKKISKIVHPIVKKKMKDFLMTNNNKKFVILDVPLYLENKLNEKKDIIIYVESKRNKIETRLRKRKNYNKILLKRLRDVQFSTNYKKKKSHFIIKNNYKNKTVKNAVLNILREIN